MRIDIQLMPYPPPFSSLSGKSIVVIDVLRATSVMVLALCNGATEIVAVTTVEEARRLAETFPAGTTLLGGERGNRKIEDFDFGNSPMEYTAERVRGKRLVLTTTNGTKALHSVASAKRVMVGSFFNIRATAKRCFDLDQDILLYPSGDEGKVSLEDVVCGGALIDLVIQRGAKPVDLTDASYSALVLYQKFKGNLIEALRFSHHGKALIDLGLEEDLFHCTQIDITDLVPTFQDGVIRVLETGKGE